MIQYYQLGAQKKLNEIVMIGSHDGAITKGAKNVQTQSLNIAVQAIAGVRIFDIRITGAIVGKAGPRDTNVGQLKAYHGTGVGTGKFIKPTVINARTLEQEKMKVKPMTKYAGAYGESLSGILNQAREFVSIHTSEFLILKFDKCSNWEMIAEACVDLLRDKIYSAGGNINTKTLQDLAGHVVVVFGSEAWSEISHAYVAKGILKFKNLYDSDAGTPKAYAQVFDGIQYVGKGGTDIKAKGNFRTFTGKMKENIKKQGKIMDQGVVSNPDALGMMYWTTTGWFTDIKKRNSFLWNPKNQEKLVELWESRIPPSVDPTALSAAPVLKTFMPNFVMVDFADGDKCNKIFELNFLSAMHAHNAALDHYQAA